MAESEARHLASRTETQIELRNIFIERAASGKLFKAVNDMLSDRPR
jgi:hypothetical protein